MKSLKFISSIIAMLISFSTIAQKRTITGTVSDIIGPLPGVNVSIQKTKKSVFTDFEGKYSIKTKKKTFLFLAPKD